MPRPATASRPATGAARPATGGPARGADEAPAEWLVALAKMLPQVYVIDRFVVKEDAAGANGGLDDDAKGEEDLAEPPPSARPVMRPLASARLGGGAAGAKRPEALEELEGRAARFRDVLGDAKRELADIKARHAAAWDGSPARRA